jgi:hypothetical protein
METQTRDNVTLRKKERKNYAMFNSQPGKDKLLEKRTSEKII